MGAVEITMLLEMNGIVVGNIYHFRNKFVYFSPQLALLITRAIHNKILAERSV